MKHYKTQITLLTLTTLVLSACDGSVMGPKKQQNKDKPVIVSTPPSSEDQRVPDPAPSDDANRNSSSPKPDSGDKNDSALVERPGQGSKPKPQIPSQTPRDNNFPPQDLGSVDGTIDFEWIQSNKAEDWIRYIFSDLPPSIKSQVIKSGMSVNLKVRSIGIDDRKNENYVVALLSFRAGPSFVRDYVVSKMVTVKNVHSIDRFRARFHDTLSGKKSFELILERRKIARNDPNGMQLLNALPWAGTLYSPQRDQNVPVANMTGTMGLLSPDEADQILIK